MVSKGAVLALDLGAPLAFYLGRYLLHGALNLGPQLAPGAPWPSPKGLRWLLI